MCLPRAGHRALWVGDEGRRGWWSHTTSSACNVFNADSCGLTCPHATSCPSSFLWNQLSRMCTGRHSSVCTHLPFQSGAEPFKLVCMHMHIHTYICTYVRTYMHSMHIYLCILGLCSSHAVFLHVMSMGVPLWVGVFTHVTSLCVSVCVCLAVGVWVSLCEPLSYFRGFTSSKPQPYGSKTSNYCMQISVTG